MKLLPGAATVLLLLLLLTWLLLRGIGTDALRYAQILRTFDEYALAEASLHRDVLQTRAGLLRNYDPLVKATHEMDNSVAKLRFYAVAVGLNLAPVDRLTAAVAEQETLTERYKTNNALLQNSLSYFGLLSTSPTFLSQDRELASATGALAAAIMHLTRDTSPESTQVVQDRLDQLAAHAPTAGPDAQAARALLAHAGLLHRLLPEIDDTLKTLLAVPSQLPLDDLRRLFSDRHVASEATARRFRLLLYATSLLLLLALVYFGLQLRARALALQRRAAFEHIVAENSTRLINCPPAETETRVKQVLGAVSQAIGVEPIRAYVVLDENPIQVIAWGSDGVTYPPGWPDQALALSARLSATGTDVVAVRDIATLPGDVRDALAAFGVRSWGLVPLVRPGRARGIMGFDALRPAWKALFPQPVVRLAGDAVANAIDRKLLERERARLATRLERARRMQTIGQFASGIAHNFNNIIAAILGYTEMAEAQVTPNSKPTQHISEIRRAAERGRDLIENILTFGRRLDAGAEPIHVRTLLKDAASLLKVSLPQGTKLIVGEVSAELTVSGQPAQLQQVILNLCNNASQAMDGSGEIRITAEQHEIAAPRSLSHGELVPARYICLAVSDTGRGFDDSVRSRLFEPFFTTRLEGTGLGLATVLEIVRDHDGAMNVQSAPGEGSRFEVWLPAVVADIGTEPLPSEKPALPLGRGETVLIVENERERLLRDEETLAALGYEPVGFARPEDALAACHTAAARFDAVVVVSDSGSNSNGFELARALHRIVSRLPVLFAAAATVDIGIDALAEAGVSEILHWPLDATELAPALARCLHSTGTSSRAAPPRVTIRND
jgi:signal transduction histidine kinase